MIGKLDPEESVMSPDSITLQIAKAIRALGWDSEDNIAVEVAGSSVYEIDGPGTKWSPLKGTKKYNKDAFIVIKNLDRNLTISSKPSLKQESKELKQEDDKLNYDTYSK
tara:strand:- start:70 stop:396 length:327 start_codon:yes stop_codon:yes gene_type:complete